MGSETRNRANPRANITPGRVENQRNMGSVREKNSIPPHEHQPEKDKIDLQNPVRPQGVDGWQKDALEQQEQGQRQGHLGERRQQFRQAVAGKLLQ